MNNFDYNFKFEKPIGKPKNFKNILVDKLKNLKKKDIFYEDEKIVCIYDNFPKSKFHLLLLPKLNEKNTLSDLKNISVLNKNHLPLLEHMEKISNEIAKHLEEKDKSIKIKRFKKKFKLKKK
jgi:diadenosine tetraphosphate (Ap4A) HIT family hydrolase